MTKNIVITGANGFIGNKIANDLAQQGNQILGLVRHLYKAPPKNIRLRAFDLHSFGSDVIPEGTDVVIHAAYIPLKKGQEDINYKATKRLFEICQRKKVKQFVFLSSFSAMPEANSIYGQSKYRIEKMLLENNALVLSPGLVIGQGGLFQSMQKIFRQSSFIPLIAGGKQPLQYILIEDLSLIIQRSIQQDVKGKFQLAHPKSIDMKRFYRTIADQLDKNIYFISIPYFMADGVFMLVERFGLQIGINRDNYLGLKQMKLQEVSDAQLHFDIELKPFL